MIAVLSAVETVVKSVFPPERTTRTTAIGDGTGLQAPYCVIWGSPAEPNPESPFDRPAPRVPVRVTCTAQNATAAMGLAEAVVDAVAPGFLPRRLDVPGFHAQIVHTDSQPVEVDRSVTLTGSNTHPAYVVLLFDVHLEAI